MSDTLVIVAANLFNEFLPQLTWGCPNKLSALPPLLLVFGIAWQNWLLLIKSLKPQHWRQKNKKNLTEKYSLDILLIFWTSQHAASSLSVAPWDIHKIAEAPSVFKCVRFKQAFPFNHAQLD